MRRFDPNQTLHQHRDRRAWPGLDLGGMTLDEIRKRVRGIKVYEVGQQEDLSGNAQGPHSTGNRGNVDNA